MVFKAFKKRKQKQPRKRAGSGDFEKAFADRLGQSPAEFIFTKLSASSDKRAVEYLYDITAAEIARRNDCKILPFSKFYPEAERKYSLFLEREAILRARQDVEKKIRICQREFVNRVGVAPFGGQCARHLDRLYADSIFYHSIEQIAEENAGIEFCENGQNAEFLRFKREILPRRMEALGITRNDVVRSICDIVSATGKSRKSALISIYYAVRMYMLSRSLSEQTTKTTDGA